MAKENGFKICISKELEARLINKGLIIEIPISDEQVIIALRSLDFEENISVPGLVRFWRLKGAEDFSTIGFAPGKVKAVADEVDITRHRGEIKAVVYYKIVGISGEIRSVEAVKKWLNTANPAIISQLF